MRRRLTIAWIVVAIGAVGTLASCSPGSDARPVTTTIIGPASTLVLEDHDVTALPSSTSLGPQQPDVSAPGNAAATVASDTIVMAAPPLPADLSPVRPAGTVTEAGEGHDHDSEADATSSDVAVAWIVAMYTARFDDPDGLVADDLTALAANAELATAALAAIEPIDLERSEARWPIITTLTDVGTRTWRVEFVVKRTLAGQVGPSTSPPLVVDVIVLDGYVTAWAAVEAS